MGSAIASFIYPVPPLCQMENMPDWSTVPTAELLAVMSTILVVLSGRLGSMAERPPLNEVLSPTEVFSEVPLQDPPVEDGSLVEFAEDGSLVFASSLAAVEDGSLVEAPSVAAAEDESLVEAPSAETPQYTPPGRRLPPPDLCRVPALKRHRTSEGS